MACLAAAINLFFKVVVRDGLGGHYVFRLQRARAPIGGWWHTSNGRVSRLLLAAAGVDVAVQAAAQASWQGARGCSTTLKAGLRKRSMLLQTHLHTSPALFAAE
jgi:hypothetical protein